AYTLFQIMTLESWSMGIVRPTMEIFPLAWVFFLPFIIITSFAVLNLFIGIIVDAMQMVQQEERSHESGLETVTTEIAALREEIRALKDTLKARDGQP
ncbi:MAG: ion transporter, partial [Pseudomonadales bacterium]